MAKAAKTTPGIMEALQAAMDAEMTGVALYTHLALRVFGPQYIGITAHLRGQATESLTHALAVGDRMSTLGAVPHVRVKDDIDHSPGSLEEILRISVFLRSPRPPWCSRAAAGTSQPVGA